MDATPTSERRVHRRHAFAGRVSVFHEPTQRAFPARSVDVSEGGMLMYVPVSTPVKAGQPIRLSVEGAEPSELAALGPEPVDCRIVRVDRHGLTTQGHLAVGVQFQGRG